MKKEELFRAIGAVEEEQVMDALAAPKRRRGPRYLAAAACLVLLAAAGLALPRVLRGGGSTPVDTQYSVNVALSELSKPPEGSGSSQSADLVWLEPEEIFALDTVIFRGTVEEMRCYEAHGAYDHVFTVAAIAVSEVYRGEVEDTCTLYLNVVPGYVTNSLAGPLDDLRVGSEAIFMAYPATSETGVRTDKGFFCYADAADFYCGEGIRLVFLDSGEGLEFEREVYQEIAGAASLDEVGDYIRRMIGEESGGAEDAEQGTQESGAAPADSGSGGA